jgi:hypothetical protein
MGSVLPCPQQATDPEAKIPRRTDPETRKGPGDAAGPLSRECEFGARRRQRRGALTGLAEVAGRDDGDPETAG